MAPLKRKLWSPTRQIVTLALAAAVSLSSVSLFHGLTLSDCAFFLDANAVLPPLSMSPPPPHASQHNKASTSLAYVQSYGLIDDVSDKSWELIRKRAHEAHTFTSSDPQAEKERIEHDNPVEWYLGSREVSLWFVTTVITTRMARVSPHEIPIGLCVSNSWRFFFAPTSYCRLT